MFETFGDFFSSEFFMPHGHCYLWHPALVWLQVISNALIGIAYVAIFSALAYLVKKGEYLPFKGMAVAFSIFIVSCGITHFFDVYVIWRPAYWVDGTVRAITALASVGTALLLPPLIPRAIALAHGAKAAHEQGIELKAAVEDIGRMYEKTKELDELKTQFFANVSHELRTPLQLILGPAEKLLKTEGLSPQQRADAEVISRNARTLLKHVNDLLDVARLEAGKLAPEYTRTDIARVVRLTAAHFDSLAAERQMTWTVDVPQTLPAEVDADKIHRVVLNLLSNAFKFTPPGGTVRCRLEARDEGQVVLEVADSGPGVPSEQRAQVFDRFRQVDGGTTRLHGGTGLGLAIVKDFVELHGGTVVMEESPEGGALVRVRLPLTAPPGTAVADTAGFQALEVDRAAAAALDELHAKVEGFVPSEGSDKPRVLVVEDNIEMNRFICETLTSRYQVEPAYDGAQGLEKARAHPPDLIISDIMMPERSGDELVAEVRKQPDLDNVPIMLLSAKADEDLRVRLLREGAQDYLMKPFLAEELHARVRNLVTMKRARDVLQDELATQVRDLDVLAREATHRKRELDTALISMKVAREHAEKASQLKTNFLRTVSHELRSPLSALQLQLERLRLQHGGELPTDKQQLLTRMGASTARLHDLIEGLLQYARVQSGGLTVEAEPIDVRALLQEIRDELLPRADDKGLTLDVEASSDLPPLESDPRLVRLMLVNLVGNAIKFTAEGRVTVTAAHDEDRYRLIVRDTGVGIPVEQQHRVFEPFEQLEPTRAKHASGVGLGLALVREMANALGGHIELQSAPGAGSTFTLVLPRVSPRDAS